MNNRGSANPQAKEGQKQTMSSSNNCHGSVSQYLWKLHISIPYERKTLRNLDLYADEAAFSPRSHHVFIMCFHVLSPELSCLSAPKCFQFSRCIFDGSTPCTAAAPDYLPRMHWVSRHCLDGEVATATLHFCETRFWVFGVKEKRICQATQCDPLFF